MNKAKEKAIKCIRCGLTYGNNIDNKVPQDICIWCGLRGLRKAIQQAKKEVFDYLIEHHEELCCVKGVDDYEGCKHAKERLIKLKGEQK